MNIAIFATKRIGTEVLRYIINEHKEHLKLIVFDKEDSEIYEEFKTFSPHVFYDEIGNHIDFIKSLDLDWIFLAWWPHIIKSDIINIPRKGVINTHNSLLPFNRGVHPNFWAIVEELEYGVSIHKVTPGVDDGDVIAQKRIAYDWLDNGDTLYEKGMVELTELFKLTYPKIVSGNYELTPQDHSVMTCHRTNEINKICNIDLTRQYEGAELLNIIRAKDCLGKPGAYFYSNGKKYEVRIKIEEIEYDKD